MPKTRNIKQTIDIQATPKVLFSHLTNQKELVKWFPTAAKTQPTEGGRFKYIWKFTKKAKHGETSATQQGKYTAIVPNVLIRHTWEAWGVSGKVTEVEFILEPRGKKTRIILIHSGFGFGKKWDYSFKDISGGWRYFLKNLKSYIEKDTDVRSKDGQIVKK